MKNNSKLATENFGVFLVALLMISPAGFALSSAQASGIGYASLRIYPGWNMVSIPFDSKVSMGDLASQCGTAPYAWRLSQSGYVKETVLVPNTGYWVKGTRDCEFGISGSGNLAPSADLFSGWNLVGAPRFPTAVSDYAGTCSIVAGPWYYDHNSASDRASPYTYSASLEPGKAYWVKVSSSCKLGSEQPPPPPSGNLAPVINSVSGPASLRTGEQGTWSVSAYDPEGKQLTYYVAWGDEPSGAAQPLVVSQTVTMTHVYYGAGTYTPTFTVVDDQGASASSSSSVVVGQIISNQPPVISTASAPASLRVNEQGTWTINAYDPENGPLTYSVVWGDESSGATAPAKLSTWQGQTATLTHAYSQPGTYTATFTVTDDHGLTAQTSSATQVVVATLQISPDGLLNGKVGQYYSATFSTSENSNWQIIAGSVPSGLALGIPTPGGQTAYLSGIPTTAGNYKFTVRATGVSGAVGEKTYVMSISPAVPNRAPVISSVGGPTNLQTGATGTWTLSAYDPEGGALMYYINWGDEASVAGSDRASTVTQGTTMTHVYYGAGTYTPTFTVVDDQGASATASVSVNVAGNLVVCPPQPSPSCPQGFASYKYTDSSGCLRYGCAAPVYAQTSAQ